MSLGYQKLSLVLFFLAATSCQSFNSKTISAGNSRSAPTPGATAAPSPSINQVEFPPEMQKETSLENLRVQNPEAPKIGLILGPGGLRAYAHVGVLQEFAQQGVPIQAILGLEMGALVGGIFSSKAQPFDVEWQMSKLKEENFFKKSFIGQHVQDVTALQKFMDEYFSGLKFEDSKISFSCPSYQLNKRQTVMINKGSLSAGIPFCLASNPLFKPHQNSVAALQALNSSVQYLRSRQVQMIFYVSLLDDKPGSFVSPLDGPSNLMWNFVSQSLENQYASAHQVIRVPMTGFELTDFDKRNQMIQKGREAAKVFLLELKKQWEFK